MGSQRARLFGDRSVLSALSMAATELRMAGFAVEEFGEACGKISSTTLEPESICFDDFYDGPATADIPKKPSWQSLNKGKLNKRSRRGGHKSCCKRNTKTRT